MSSKDIFDNPFDEGTLTKLEIFEKYFEKWLPTFVLSRFTNPIQVFDLFAGSGFDKNDIPGSPIRIIEIINKYSTILKSKNKIVHLFFNDLNSKKIKLLEKNVSGKITGYGLSSCIEITYTNKTFSECLTDYSSILSNGCNLIFLDQNGFKEVNEVVFKQLIILERTDFMFFISSTHIHRFVERPEFQSHHPKFDTKKIKSAPRKRVHNVICEEFSKYVPSNIKSYGLIPFSLMKEDRNNIYGLIFVCKHFLSAEKFLNIVWRQNALNGNANYDINEDVPKNQLELFEVKKLTKIELFQSQIRDKVITKDIKNNSDAYFFALNEGHICGHAASELRKMKQEKLITFDNSSPLVTYEQIFKAKRILEYKVLNT
ncbi:MAG: three-Cys-motif partner protein TcmP [Ignavibacteriaceae bacterium]|nr:three-Cys-motif partner protein TcmP [Ignavibacteriaceae bacterium]